jgi:hypothetical protein
VLRRHPLLAFLPVIALVWAVGRAALASAAAERHPDLMAGAVALDLSVTVTVLFWLAAVRPGAAGPASLALVLALGAALAARTLPPGQRAWAAGLVVVAEAALLGSLAWRASRLARAYRAQGALRPPEDALLAAARQALGPSRLVEAVATEAAILWLALGSWRRAPHVPAGWRPFSSHRTAGHGAVLVALLLVTVAEMAGLHLLLLRWSERWAWGASGLGLYGLLWLLGDWRAVVLRPTLLGEAALEVRVGLRWRAIVPLASLRSVCPGSDRLHHPRAFRASPLGPPTLYLHLAEPAEWHGLFGLRRRAAVIGLRVDDAAGLTAALRQRLPGLPT